MMAPQKEPFERFEALYALAQSAQPKDPNAVSLATVDGAGRPSVRIVLMKSVDEHGFVVFTNYHSRKGQELLGQKVAALCFYWPSLDSQVRVEGTVSVISDEESDAYFATRPRVSQLGAWASNQSQVLDARETLETRLQHFDKQYAGQNVPRPAHWGGFRIAPSRIEFWKAGDNRLHHRTVYTHQGDGWKTELLFP
ncbi:MAG: pyridoxamine 5'-phosphate oxidase [Myxococcaceae bacterium]|nr:pyridoxamine 5'-phosphate oxidase [Myxococcaceae bacterium]